MLYGHDEGKNIKQLCNGETNVVCIEMGGTGADNAEGARNNILEGEPLAIEEGGTGAATAAAALAALGISDYVTETGTTDGWTWQKWNSGRYEAERVWNVGQVTVGNTLSTNRKASNVITVADTPHTLINGAIEVNLIGNTSNSGIGLERVGNTEFRLTKDASSSVTLQNVTVSLRVVSGTWK